MTGRGGQSQITVPGVNPTTRIRLWNDRRLHSVNAGSGCLADNAYYLAHYLVLGPARTMSRIMILLKSESYRRSNVTRQGFA